MDFPKEEYEIQYYDFCLTDFADQTKLMVDEVVRGILNTAWKKVKDKEGPSTATEEEEKKALGKTVALISQKVTRNMKPYEDLLDKYLSIPEFVILPEDKRHDVVKYQDVSEADMLNHKIQCQSLECEVTEMAKVIRSLEEELEQYEKVKQSFGDMELLIELVESRLKVDIKSTDLKKAVKNIEGLIVDKNGKSD